jgi:rfaE bifunctional protein kinase chain/domain
MSLSDLVKSISKLRGRRILIVGDVGLDEYVMGQVRRISPEAPVPIVEVSEEDRRLGLASNVAANVAGLEGTAVLVGVVGDDDTGKAFQSLLRSNGVSPDYLIVDAERPTTRKLRVMSGHHHIVRVDFERKKFLSKQTEDRLLARVREVLPNCDAVILEDYAKGVLSERVLQTVISEAHKAGKSVTLDPNKNTPTVLYKGVDYLTPNTDEAMSLSGLPLDDLRSPSETFSEVGAALLEKLGARAVVITRGKEGMSLFEKGGVTQGHHIPTFARSVFDVTGAGDTVIATFTLALASGLLLKDACTLANYAAGVVVGRVGCVSITPADLQKYIETQVFGS